MPNVAASEDAGSSKIGSAEYRIFWQSHKVDYSMEQKQRQRLKNRGLFPD